VRLTITPDQLHELPTDHQHVLSEWLTSRGYPADYLSKLSIGLLIDFLADHRFEYYVDRSWVRFLKSGNGNLISWREDTELVDVLWEAVKQVLRGEFFSS
jgi:hypothetical protein